MSSNDPKQLILHTATPQGCVAVMAGQQLIASRVFDERGAHVTNLPDAVVALCGEAGWTLRDLDWVTCTIGPGAFAGARIALAYAKGLQTAWQTPIVPCDTLRALAMSAVEAPSGVIAALMDARRGELFGALYDFGVEPSSDAAPRELLPPCLLTPDAMQAAIAQAAPHDTEILLTGDGAPLLPAPLDSWTQNDTARGQVDPAALGRLGAALFSQGGGGTDPGLEPLYIRRSEAEENRLKALTEAS
ncbi:tRNA (adenosine(37)-N6)-threonylcarbamoyltransferase complex dimerization subunit type 1 TsaB [Magnetofaba australis]|uniref:Putative peptidase M22, glycoprotease n=1 Tax=Magnetofaba australis IT-1 TaxID=1434232 RepID=A0A1Y2K5Q8_9PROT|nr:tRNA (adenosine(37)-N6)-threonylcarbamoyltransferase complex dimerization subunit type 1 TsaB [Magnetofaba australis]OSM02335.1 putative peptidase M22, glycoprotease [Magnetofaba australis IT-1]